MRGKGKYLLSILVPVFNEEDNVHPAYEAIKQELEKISDQFDYEIIFTDNRSTDTTFARIAELARKDERVRVARLSKNFGYQRSIYTGYCLAKGDLSVEIDCDLQDPPRMIHDFIAKWKEGYDVVYGARVRRKESWFMNQIRLSFYRIINFLSEDNLPLDAGDFRLVDRKVIDQLKSIYDATPYLRGAIAEMGFNQIGIPYERDQRLRGASKYNLSSLFSLALDGVLNHSIVPLRCATFTGFFISIGLIAYFIGLLFLSIFFDYPWPRGFKTTTVLILTSISLNALFLGVIGEYLGRIYRQIKRLPIAIIDQTINLEDTVTTNSP